MAENMLSTILSLEILYVIQQKGIRDSLVVYFVITELYMMMKYTEILKYIEIRETLVSFVPIFPFVYV